MNYQGSCHCQAIKFEIDAPRHLQVDVCNCSICAKSGYLHFIIPKSKFTLVTGTEYIATYRFNTGVAQHMFCKVCGIKPFYIPRSNPDGIDINVRCLDTKPIALSFEGFDGRNWEQHAHKFKDRCKE